MCWPTTHGVRCPDDKEKQYFAKADPSRFETNDDEPCFHNVELTDPDLAAVFSRWYTGSACGFAAAIEPVTRFVLSELRRLLEMGAKLFVYRDDRYTWIKPVPPRLHCSGHCRHLFDQPRAPTLQDSDMGGFMQQSHPFRVGRQDQTHTQMPRRPPSHPGRQ